MIRRIGIFLSCYIFLDCSPLVSFFGQLSGEKTLWKKVYFEGLKKRF